MTLGSRATGTHEPCQGRNAAALSESFCVPWGSLGWVNCRSNVYEGLSRCGARIKKVLEISWHIWYIRFRRGSQSLIDFLFLLYCMNLRKDAPVYRCFFLFCSHIFEVSCQRSELSNLPAGFLMIESGLPVLYTTERSRFSVNGDRSFVHPLMRTGSLKKSCSQYYKKSIRKHLCVRNAFFIT
jgi:hypothetical protein